MKHLTVRNLPPEIARALEKEKRRTGKSLNQTVIDLVSHALGIHSPVGRRNGLARLAGSWSPEEFAAFEEAVAAAEQVDEELWR